MRVTEHAFAVVMAGGSGTRFWPQSRRGRPKQFLPLAGGKPLFRTIIERLCGLIPPGRIIIVTGRAHLETVRVQAPEIPEENLIGEPEGRDTAPCLCVAAHVAGERDPDAVLISLPADHVIEPADGLYRTLRAGLAHIASRRGVLCTIGIRPDGPATGFGYIRRGQEVDRQEGLAVFEVRAFREKPDRATAESYLASGEYDWNAGIFIWRVADFRDELRHTAPDLADALDAFGRRAAEGGFSAALEEFFPRMRRVSIDYALLEKARRVVTVPADFHWADVGSWQALDRLTPPDAQGNIVSGKAVLLDTRDSIVVTDAGVVAAIDIEGLVVVRSGDCLLVCRKESAQRVREIVAALRERGEEAHL
ncbi:MAG: mannose-1-phosphate guanylyltransferase [Planctomycetes bacterium]|nr:mannose-1-phosphate guanylyltransferase [Planctomycetota bacterium]